MACYALKANAPYGFTAAVITRDVFVTDILVYIVCQFKELRFVLGMDAFLTEVIIWLVF